MRKHFLLGIIFIFSFFTYVYASTIEVKWIYGSNTSSRFTSETVGLLDAYKDTFTGLSWQKNPPTYPLASVTWEDAVNYCQSIGDGNWRLPTKNEHFAIISFGVGEKNSADNRTMLESINDGPEYWTSTNNPSDVNKSWVTNFYYAEQNNYSLKTGTKYIICVHD